MREPAPAPVPAGRDGGFVQLLGERNILLCVLIACSYITWFIILISFTPTFLIQVKGMSPQAMGAVMSSLGFAWVAWGALVPAISDRIGRKPAMVGFSLIAACCPLVLLNVDRMTWLLPLVFLSYTGLGCFTLFMATIPAETVSPRRIATALGMIMGVGELAGGFVAPTVAGFAADRYGLSIVMWIAMAGALLPALLSLGLRETAPLRLKPSGAVSEADRAPT
ncbi:MFS transporter [Chromobacterium haemolyticum]|uniref:MFS transporter n=1 Tax=Chromobacterium haemolyticum TaxID=394935 RepID=UPI0002D2C26C|nr:MFS transporter [Chromobacterium haemolyticum]